MDKRFKVMEISAYDYKADYCQEHPKGESVTVPGEAMTVREIFDRYVRKQEIDPDQQRAGMYYDDDLDFDSTDYEKVFTDLPVEKQEYLESLKLDIEIKRKQLNDFLEKYMEEQGTSQGLADTDAQKREGPSPDAGGKPTRKERRRKADDEEGDVSRASGGEFGQSSSARGDSKKDG